MFLPVYFTADKLIACTMRYESRYLLGWATHYEIPDDDASYSVWMCNYRTHQKCYISWRIIRLCFFTSILITSLILQLYIYIVISTDKNGSYGIPFKSQFFDHVLLRRKLVHCAGILESTTIWMNGWKRSWSNVLERVIVRIGGNESRLISEASLPP